MCCAIYSVLLEIVSSNVYGSPLIFIVHYLFKVVERIKQRSGKAPLRLFLGFTSKK